MDGATETVADHPGGRPILVTCGRWLAVALALLGLVAVLNAVAAHAITPDSDAASLVLEAQSILAGHLLLHGWALSLDSFWTSEVPFYALASLVGGLHPALLSVVPAIIGASVVTVGAVIARDGQGRGAGLAGALTVVALLAFPTHALALFFLLGGAHLGVTLGALVAFYALRRRRWDLGVVVAIVVLTAGMLGDLQEIAYATLPVLAAGFVAMARRRSVGEGLPAVFAASAASVLALAIRQVADALGTFSIGTPNPIATPHQVLENLRHLISFGGEMLGLRNGLFGSGGVPTGLQDVHAVGAILVVVCVVVAFVRLGAGIMAGPARRAVTVATGAHDDGVRWWQSNPSGALMDDMLTLACVGSAASYLALASMNTAAFARYLTATVVFMIVLAGRVTARAWSRPAPDRRKWAVGLVGAVVIVCFATGLGFTISKPVAPQPATHLASWLEKNHLTSGVGAYTVASITTVQSQDQVKIRPVVAAPSGRLVRYDRESDATWYKGKKFRFVVYAPKAPWGKVNTKSADATFGTPAHSYLVSGYRVLVWRRSFTVSPKRGFGS